MSINHLTHQRGEGGRFAPVRALPEGFEFPDSQYWTKRTYQVAQDLLKYLYKEDYLNILDLIWPGEAFNNATHKQICLVLDKIYLTIQQEHPEKVMLELTPEELVRLAGLAQEASK